VEGGIGERRRLVRFAAATLSGSHFQWPTGILCLWSDWPPLKFSGSDLKVLTLGLKWKSSPSGLNLHGLWARACNGVSASPVKAALVAPANRI
jgi:hypothetical protein